MKFINSKKALSKIQAIVIAVIIVIAAIASGVYYYYVTQPSAPSQGPTPTTPETFVFTEVGAHWAEIKFGDDPALDSAECAYIPLVYETLFTYDPITMQKGQYKLIPWLAESYTVSSDGLTYTIKLRHGVKFHSGNVMTADDVVYSLNRYWFYDWSKFTQYLPWPIFKIMPNNVVSFNKVDGYTVQIKLNGTIPHFLEYLAGTQWSIVDSKLVKAHEKTLPEYGNVKDYGYTWLGVECGDAGTGPYKVKSIDMTVRYEFERFDDYWGGPPELNLSQPYFKKIVFIPTSEDADARMKLLRGDIYLAADFLTDTMKALKGQSGVKLYQGYSPHLFGLWMHTVNGPLANWRVRKAIKMALNYTEIQTVANANGSITAEGFFLPGMEGWQKNAHYFPGAQYDEANTLLDEAGYPVKEDGWRFHINLYIRPSPRFGLDFTKNALVIRSDLAKVKIDAVPVVLQPSEYYAHAYKPGESMMWLQPAGTVGIISSPMMLLSYWGMGQAWYFGFNATTQPEIADKISEMKSLYNQTLNTLDEETRISLMQQIESIVLEYGPWVTTSAALYHVAYNNHLSDCWWGPKAIFPSIFYMKYNP